MLELKNNFIEELQVKDMDNKKGIVAFYFAPFRKYDTHKDIHETKSFDDAIKNFKPDTGQVLHFRDHIAKVNGYDHNEVPGVLKEIGKDSEGAFAVSQLALKTIVGRDTFEQYEAGVIKQHSYGAVASTSKSKSDGKGGRILIARDIKEVSSLTSWAASDQTPVISLKSLHDAEMQLKAINDALHTGNISDEQCLKLSTQYIRLKAFLEKKDGFMELMRSVTCWNCNQLQIPYTLVKDEDGNGICDNCGKCLDVTDGSEPSDEDDDDDNDGENDNKASKLILEQIKLGQSTDTVKEILSNITLETKKDFSDDERKKLAKSGAAMADGSFPITDAKDLKDAIADWGRAGSKPAVKAHIISRAKSLGLSDTLPDDWKN